MLSVPHRDIDGLARSGSSSMIDSTLVFISNDAIVLFTANRPVTLYV